MSAEAWLALGALVVAVVAVPSSIWATRRWGTRRAQLQVSVRSLPLLPEDMRPGLLEVTYRDIPVDRPHLVSVTLENVGPRDIPSSAFDGGRPIYVAFDQTFYGLTSTSGGVRTLSPAIGTRAADAVVELAPGLLKCGEVWSFSAVLSGPVKVSVKSPLIDTDLQRPDRSNDASGAVLSIGFLGLSADIPIRRRTSIRAKM
ncbi:hypothetical protein GCM10022235_15650 [Kribbella ginsengisoli]|uniref:DUF4352 domain-containing protein n=1 Tax=Kribbella ginsengisoli TaxID=363865 RepID=A0ABP6WF43_9ACTN